MTTKGKYEPLFYFLCSKKQNTITIPFTKLERILKDQLPQSACSTHAWWSNRTGGGLQSQAWLAAGYRVATVDLEKQQVTFRKLSSKYKARRVGDRVIWDGELIKGLRHHMNLNQSQFAEELHVRQGTVSEWERGKYQPKPAMSKLLTIIADRVNFPYK